MSVEKKEGATMICGTCGLELICRSKTYPAYEDHAAKTVLQWQNDKGGAHYKWIGPEKFKCVDQLGNDIPIQDQGSQSASKIESPQVTQSKGRDKQKDDNLDQVTTSVIERETDLLYKIRNIVKNILIQYDKDPHGGMIGQFTEIIYNKHFGEKKIV